MRRFLVACTLLIAVLIVTHSWWLYLIGRALVHDDGPAHAQVAVVLAGDARGARILKGAELVRDGYVSQVLVSGPDGLYGHHESDLAIAFAVANGYPREWFIPVPNQSLSTREEARDMIAELQRRNIGSYLLVTSDYHTGRARRIYLATARQMGGPAPLRVVAAPDRNFRYARWWQSREGLKAVFMEWTKTIATAVGI